MDDAAVVILGPDEIVLAEHAAVIRALGRRVVGDVIEIGRRLIDSRRRVGHGNWLPWLDREFGWSETTALRFMQVAELAAKSVTVTDLNIPMRGLYLLAAPNTPAEVQEAVIARAEAGEQVTQAEIKTLIAEAQATTESAAQKRLDAERIRFETLLADARQAADQRVEALRASYADKLIFDPDEMAKVTAKLKAPLEQKIAKYEAKLAAIAEREAKRKAAKPPTQPPIDGAALTASAAVSGALAALAGRLTLSPAEMVAIERRCLSATGETLATRLGATLTHAALARAWLDGFLAEASDERAG